MPFYCQRKAVSLVAKRPFTTRALKMHIHSNTWLWVVLDVLFTRSAVIFRSFLSQFWGVKWLGNGRKVTLLRVENDFGATRRWRCLQQSSTIGAGWVHVFHQIVHPILLDYQAFTRQSSTCSRIIDYIAVCSVLNKYALFFNIRHLSLKPHALIACGLWAYRFCPLSDKQAALPLIARWLLGYRTFNSIEVDHWIAKPHFDWGQRVPPF